MPVFAGEPFEPDPVSTGVGRGVVRSSVSFSAIAFAAAAAFTAVRASVAADSASTEAPVDEVIIQSSLRGEAVGDLPASVTVLDAETLHLAGQQHFGDVLQLVPNLNWSAGTSRPRYFQLRGIGELEQFQGAPNASVGFLIDDIDFSGIGMPAMLFDLEQIEVLRGPQGTAYGANALAGLISVRSRAPSRESELHVEASAGDYGTSSLGAVMGGAVGASDGAFRLSAKRYRSDGFRRNVFLGRNDTNGYDETGVRGRLSLAPSDALSLDLTAVFVDMDNGYDAFAIDNSRVTHSDKPGADAQRSLGLAARADYSGFSRFTLRSTTAFADSDVDYSFDGDWGNDAEWGIYAPYDYVSTFVRTRRTLSQDLRLVSNPGEEIAGRAAWVAGLYAMRATEENDQLDLFNGETWADLESRYEAMNVAAYGEIDVEINDRAHVSFGSRVERRQADYEDTNGMAFDPSETLLGGHLSLTYDLGRDRSWYATLSRGYKAGGFNIGISVPDEREQYDAEFLWNLETGLKGWLIDGTLSTETALFYMRRKSQQVTSSVQLDPDNPLTFVFFTDNASSGENYGIESALQWFASSRLTLGASVGLLETQYIDYEFSGERDLGGREQAHAPQYQLTLSAQYRHPAGFIARLDAQTMDDFYFDVSHDERATAHSVVNLKIGYESQRWATYLWARNLLDEEYAMRGFFFANEPEDFTVSHRYVQPGDPRQVGITFNYSFW
jgi:iron complex outermembrane receptor protein